jgi:enoyl-CoA hydratase/carnithine racemase
MQKDLDTLTAAVDDDASVGAVVLTGGVPKRYITHFDIAEILAAASRVGLADFGSGAAEPPARC